MKGVTFDLALRERARTLRGQGLVYREIAERLGVALPTAHQWCTDPDGSLARFRQDRYRGVCEQCGEVTDGSRGPARAPKVCASCLEWPEDAVIAAMQDWAEQHGGIPPTTTQWRHAAPDHPAADTVRRVGWNNLLLKAGFSLRRDLRPETQAEIERRLTEGESPERIAESFGWTKQNIYGRLCSRGLTIDDFRVDA